MGSDLINLPFAIQIALAGGYAAYLIAFSGLRQHHTPTDVIFRTLTFGLVASASLKLLPTFGIGELESAALAFAATLLVGAVWRAHFGYLAKRLIRWLLISWSDDLPTAWLSITAERTDLRPSQIVVELNDGRLLMCDNTREFANAPFECGIFGLDGSVAMYVTSERRPNGRWIEHPAVIHDHEGANITYIAPTNIKRVEIRHWREKRQRKILSWLRRGRA